VLGWVGYGVQSAIVSINEEIIEIKVTAPV
jgi:hypothetical protein